MNYRSRILTRIQVDLKRDSTKPVIYSSLIIFFLFSMIFIFFIPSLGVINKLREKNLELRDRREYLEKLYVNYKQSADYYDEIKDQAFVLEKNIPKDKDPYYFVRQLNNYGVKNDVVFQNTRLIKKENGEEGYDANLKGDYSNIQNFFKDLKTDPRFFSTELLTLTPSILQLSNTNSLTLGVKIYVFYK